MEPGAVSAIEVLLVDDDAEWLSVASSSLADRDDDITVLTATSGVEALDVFGHESIDCVVCDYRMPGMDGLEVLERVREKGTVPFVLVTGSGSEVVASRAIAADVTDYFVKDPARDQSESLARRIRSAVAAHRTRQELATARRRFGALFENVPDPVAIVDDGGGIYGLNDAFERTFGVEGAAVEGEPIEGCIAGTEELSGGGPAVADLSLSTVEGSRNFLARRFSLDAEGVGYVFTDVTDHRERQRTLERALELDAEVRELFLSAASREDVERAFCETVIETDDAAFAAVLAPENGGGVAVRARASGPSAGDGPAWAGEDSPVERAMRERSTEYVPDLGALGDEWAAAAREAGVGSVLAVPITRNGVPDGAFALALEVADGLDADGRARMEDLVDSLGDAVYLVERMSTLAADSVVRVRLSADGEDPLTAAAAAADGGVSVTAVHGTGPGTSTYVDVEAPEVDAVCERLAGGDGVEAVDPVREGEPARLRVRESGATLPGIVVERGASVHSVTVGPEGYEATVDVRPSGDVAAVVDAIETAFERTTVRSIRSHDRHEGGFRGGHLTELTDRQLAALRTAYAEGYFETPRRRSAEEIADSLSIAGSTFLQHLRAAERKLLSSVLSTPD
jgi:CheY-like chemotaxis protein